MLKKIVLSVLSCSFISLTALGAQRPNIVLMYVDDLDFDQISVYDHRKCPCYTGAHETGNFKELSEATAFQNGRFLKVGEKSYHKNARVLTPNISRLAASGKTFNRFYLTSSTCTPSRYSLLTGRYASRAPSVQEECPTDSTPIIGWNSYLDAGENNIARDLKKAGYTTALVGKWHISSYEIDGLDFSRGYKDHHAKNGTAKGLLPFQLVDSYFPLTADYGDADVQKEIGRIYEAMRRKVQCDSGFDVVDRLYYSNYGGLPLPKHMKVHNLEWLTEGALQFIDKNQEKPFFLFLSLTAPHGSYFEDWMQKDWRATPAGMLTKIPKGMPSRGSVLQRIRQAGLPPQNAMATWIDDSLGAVMNKLEENGLSENTIVLFISDHQSRGKLTTYEGHRAPAIINWPGFTNGTTEERICSNIDILPTLLNIANTNVAAGNICDGKSLIPILKSEPVNNWRDSILLETSYSRAVVSKDWKFIANRPPAKVLQKMEADKIEALKNGRRRHVGWSGRTTKGASGMGVRFNADRDFPHYFAPNQLYNLGDDIFEQHNLYDNPEHAARLGELKEKMDRHINQLPHSFEEFGKDKADQKHD
ncbi:MAG: sulfatase-like hydrolase/transferase [Lentisphaeraceae bacterium]|nr:sulfatase-like hydrolase/transferase [Lentisphaeraceae bacterium]